MMRWILTLARKKPTYNDTWVKVTIIGAIATVAAYAIGSPLANSMYLDRPLVDISLGKSDGTLPKEELQHDGTNYYVEMAMRNRGQSDGKILVSAFGDGADVSFTETGPYQYFSQLSFVVFAENEVKISKFYVKPHENAEQFTVRISAEANTGSSYFQNVNPFIPLELTYKKSNDKYVLTDRK